MDRANGAGPGSAAAAAAALRAERFEDEKRRIVDSCFSKKDTDGSRKLTSNPRAIANSVYAIPCMAGEKL